MCDVVTFFSEVHAFWWKTYTFEGFKMPNLGNLYAQTNRSCGEKNGGRLNFCNRKPNVYAIYPNAYTRERLQSQFTGNILF